MTRLASFLLPIAFASLLLLSCAQGAGVSLAPGAPGSGGSDVAEASAGTDGTGNADGGGANGGQADGGNADSAEAGQPLACENTCTLDHASASCVDGSCELDSCDSDWGDCDGDPTNGCEQDLTDSEHCGACNVSCSLDNAVGSCASATCEIDSCQDGWGDCNDYAGDGCETGLNTPADCGGCGVECVISDNVETIECLSGSCLITACSGDWMDCDNDPTNGCELDTTSEPCSAQFPYPPANFDPTTLDSSSAPDSTVLDCGVSIFNSTTGAFTDWCGQAEPAVVMQSQVDGPEVAIVVLQNFTLAEGSTLQLEGDYPVILAVFGDATIAGIVDTDASGAAPGPGGNLSCDSSAGGDGVGDTSSGGSGGGGGGFGTAGGSGGNHGSSDRGGSAGSARGSATLTPLQGGCPGGTGGGCTGGGGGGGAVQISAAGSLVVIGTVRAQGGNGAEGCGSEGGGSGGGSGGGILLEGNAVDLTGSTLEADGGNGGRGAGGGDGGDGAVSADSDGSDGQNESANGAGGGGGGYGRIQVNSLTSCTGCP